VRRTFCVTMLLGILLFFSNLSASVEDDFNEGVDQYNSGNYEAALILFQDVLSSGNENAELHYNLANCYYKTGLRGMAIAHYLNALRIDPRSDDIKANLQFVRSTLRDKYDDSLRNPIWSFIKDTSLSLKANELATLFCILYFLLIAFLIYMVFYKEKNMILIIIVFTVIFLIVLSGSMLAINMKLNYYNPSAVIIEPEVQVLAGPGAASDIRFTAHEGLTFKILRQESGYFEVIFANNLKGWIEISKAWQYQN
jgi:tetratricopeptide (TPR) repeat protein